MPNNALLEYILGETKKAIAETNQRQYKKPTNKKKYLAYNQNGFLIGEWNNLQEMAYRFGTSVKRLRKHISDGSAFESYTFRKSEDFI